MLKKILLLISVITGCVVIIFIIYAADLVYRVEFERKVRDTNCSPDGKYSAELVEIGEPEFPFGDAHGKLLLKKGKKVISRTVIEVSNDGGPIWASNWSVEWQDDRAVIVINAEEAADRGYILYMDGRTENMDSLPTQKEE